ncbi:MAG: hypothetical protein KA248_01850 [Kiritimatiellae bacterium]|nr:hypothetical protein [Kiritimatiellia bacterium]
MSLNAVFDIAGIRYSLEKSPGGVPMEFGSAHRHFLSDGEPDLQFRAVDGPWPALDGLEKLFDSTSYWSLFKAGDRRVFSFFDTVPPYTENRRAVLSADFRSGTVYCRREVEQKFPLTYPLEELIFISALPSFDGVIIHSCGAGDETTGNLFVGVSGAGKSTMSKVLMKGTDWKVLSDDRIILRKVGNDFRMFGTPWHGEVDVCENLGLPLRRIYFLKKSPENRAVRWPPAQAAAHLIARSFPPFWDAEGIDRTTGLCAEIATRVPCYELGFVPEASVLECLAGLKD